MRLFVVIRSCNLVGSISVKSTYNLILLIQDIEILSEDGNK